MEKNEQDKQIAKQIVLGMLKTYLKDSLISNEEYIKMVKYVREK